MNSYCVFLYSEYSQFSKKLLDIIKNGAFAREIMLHMEGQLPRGKMILSGGKRASPLTLTNHL